MCFNFVRGPSAIYSLRLIFLTTRHAVATSFLTSSHQHSDSNFMLHTCRYTRRRVEHIWSICTAGSLSYRKAESDIISLLSTSKNVAFFRMFAKLKFRNTSAGNQLMDYTYRRRRRYHDARRHRTGRNVKNYQVVPKRRPGWTVYGALLLRYLLLLPPEAELSISNVLLPFTWRHIAFPSALFCPSPITQSHRTTVPPFLFALRSLRAWNTLAVGSVISGDSFLSQPDDGRHLMMKQIPRLCASIPRSQATLTSNSGHPEGEQSQQQRP